MAPAVAPVIRHRTWPLSGIAIARECSDPTDVEATAGGLSVAEVLMSPAAHSVDRGRLSPIGSGRG